MNSYVHPTLPPNTSDKRDTIDQKIRRLKSSVDRWKNSIFFNHMDNYNAICHRRCILWTLYRIDTNRLPRRQRIHRPLYHLLSQTSVKHIHHRIYTDLFRPHRKTNIKLYSYLKIKLTPSHTRHVRIV